MRWWLGMSMALVLAGTSACDPLDPMVEGECGNGAVDQATEDCDTYPSHQCRPPGEPFACRLSCDPSEEDQALLCPEGMTCGEDEVCRQHKGSFEQQAVLDLGNETRLSTGDFDRDGNDDLVADSPYGLWVLFSDDKGNPVEAVGFNAVNGAPAIGQLTAKDSGADLALPGNAVMVARGQADRTIQPTMYASYGFGLEGAKIVLMDVLPERIVLNEYYEAEAFFSGDEVVFLAGDRILVQMGDGIAPIVDLPNGHTVADLVGRPRVGNVMSHASSPCEELVFLLEGEAHVFLYTPCTPESNSTFGLAIGDGALHAPIQLPFPADPNTTVLLAHVNDDPYLDVIVGVDMGGYDPNSGGDAFLFVSYGLGDGSFHSVLQDLGGNIAVVDATVGAQPNMELRSRPLAAARLNKDPYIDLVTAEGILLSTAESQSQAIEDIVYRPAESSSLLWNDAQVVDVNGNGMLDVVATAEGEASFAFFNNAGDAFNRFDIPLDDPALLLAIGDYDGDLLPDIAVVEGQRDEDPVNEPTPAMVPGSHTLSVAFGNPVGGPSAPVKMGRLPTIEQLVVGRLDLNEFDGMDDLLVVTRSPDGNTNVAILPGSTGRQLVSPFHLEDSESDATDHVPVGLVLGRFQDEDGHLDLAVLTESADASVPDPPTSQEGDVVTIGGGPGWLWLLRSTGEAELDPGFTSRSAQLPLEFTAKGALMGAVDLDGQEPDELVLLSEALADGDGACVGTLLVARADDLGGAVRTWTFDSTARVLDESFSANSNDGICGFVYGGPMPPDPEDPADNGFDDGMLFAEYQGQLEVVDIDGDGRDEVVALGKTEASSNGMMTFTSSIVIFANGKSGTIDEEDIIRPANIGSEPPTAFAFLNADADKALEMVVLTLGTAYLADVDLAGQQLVLIRELDQVRGGRRVTSADFNGDGLADLAVSDLTNATIYLGQSRL